LPWLRFSLPRCVLWSWGWSFRIILRSSCVSLLLRCFIWVYYIMVPSYFVGMKSTFLIYNAILAWAITCPPTTELQNLPGWHLISRYIFGYIYLQTSTGEILSSYMSVLTPPRLRFIDPNTFCKPKHGITKSIYRCQCYQ
jgi:hypothetical protein